MLKGSCMCGATSYEVKDELTDTIICHCSPCHKVFGINGSANILVSIEKLIVTSSNNTPYTHKGGSGHALTYCSCDTCPTVFYTEGQGVAGYRVLKPGTLDAPDIFEKCKPVIETFTVNKASWCGSFEGAQHFEEVPVLDDQGLV